MLQDVGLGLVKDLLNLDSAHDPAFAVEVLQYVDSFLASCTAASLFPQWSPPQEFEAPLDLRTARMFSTPIAAGSLTNVVDGAGRFTSCTLTDNIDVQRIVVMLRPPQPVTSLCLGWVNAVDVGVLVQLDCEGGPPSRLAVKVKGKGCRIDLFPSKVCAATRLVLLLVLVGAVLLCREGRRGVQSRASLVQTRFLVSKVEIGVEGRQRSALWDLRINALCSPGFGVKNVVWSMAHWLLTASQRCPPPLQQRALSALTRLVFASGSLSCGVLLAHALLSSPATTPSLSPGVRACVVRVSLPCTVAAGCY